MRLLSLISQRRPSHQYHHQFHWLPTACPLPTAHCPLTTSQHRHFGPSHARRTSRLFLRASPVGALTAASSWRRRKVDCSNTPIPSELSPESCHQRLHLRHSRISNAHRPWTSAHPAKVVRARCAAGRVCERFASNGQRELYHLNRRWLPATTTTTITTPCKLPQPYCPHHPLKLRRPAVLPRTQALSQTV